MYEGGTATSRRLPFQFQAQGGVGRLSLSELVVGPLIVDKLELEVTELNTDPGPSPAERFQRRRTQLRELAVRVAGSAIDSRIAQVGKHLAGLGVTAVSARLNDGYISLRARAADGLAAADLSFRVSLVSSGAQLRALAHTVRVHGHLPTPAPVIADRVLAALFGATDAAGVVERPHARGLCDVEVDLVGALLWHLMPPSGWRLPAIRQIELVHIRVGRSAIEIAYGPAGTRSGELGVRPQTLQLAAAHDLMHSVDAQLREGHFDEAMRGYRALLASSGPDQPLLLERILALAAARPAWFFDGLELARQALGRWPQFPPAYAALASITLAQGDAREAAKHLENVARVASAESDDDQAALAALAGARLVRVLDPKTATQLYQLALEHDPGSAEAADSLADRLADEQRWPELVRLVRARAATTTDRARAVALRLRLADVFVHQLADPANAQQELAAARELAPDDPAVHEMTATILAASDPAAALVAWSEVARLAEARDDHRTCARAWAMRGELLAKRGGDARGDAEDAWRRALELDPMQADALIGLAGAAEQRGEHEVAADLYERLRGLGLPQLIAARHELEHARSLVALQRNDDARAALRRATLAGGETAAEAHAVLAEIAEATSDRDHAVAELDTAISSLVDLATDEQPDHERLVTRAAELAVARATLFDKTGQPAAASADWQRAHHLARTAAPAIARDAARTMLARSGDDAVAERRWIDAVLATRPPHTERAALLVRRAEVRRRERTPDLAAALADLHEALLVTEDDSDAAAIDARRRAYQLEAELLAQSGDQRARAQALAALAKLAERAADRVEHETAAAAAWLAADEPAAALPHGARAHASMATISQHGPGDIPAALRREVLVTLGEAAWRQRAWTDVIRAYRGLIEDPGAELSRIATFRYRLAVAADRTSDPALAVATLRPLVDNPDAARTASPELRAQALRLFADLAERAGDLAGAATALENFAALAVEGSATARADAMYRAGELFRRAERGDDAIRCLETALRISDTHLPALDALETSWRERGDLERVSVILGRKVAATARHPARQKPLLSRLGDLQDQLGRPDVALATHQRALEIDPMWRPSLRYVTLRLRDAGQVVAAAGGLAQLAGELHGDQGVDFAVVTRERQIAATALAELVAALDAAQLDAVREVARPALERAALDNIDVTSGLARLRGEPVPPAPKPTSASADGTAIEEDTASGRTSPSNTGALSLRDAAARARADGKLDEAFATLETANHVKPGDPAVLRELVELATELGDHAAAARHLSAFAEHTSGARRGDALLELADIYYDKLEDAPRGREAMRRAADAFGAGSRRDVTLRLLATEAGTNLAWDVAVDALLAIALEKRTAGDFASLATALLRAGRDADAIATLEGAHATRRFDDGGELLRQLKAEVQRKIDLVRSLEQRAETAADTDEAAQLRDEAHALRSAIGQPGHQPLRDAIPTSEASSTESAPWPTRTKTKPGTGPKEGVTPAPIPLRPVSRTDSGPLPAPDVAPRDVATPDRDAGIAARDVAARDVAAPDVDAGIAARDIAAPDVDAPDSYASYSATRDDDPQAIGTRDVATRDSAALDSDARDSAARDSAARDSAARDSAARDSAALDSDAGIAARDVAAPDSYASYSATRDSDPQAIGARDVAAPDSGIAARDVTTRDSAALDGATRDSAALDSATRDSAALDGEALDGDSLESNAQGIAAHEAAARDADEDDPQAAAREFEDEGAASPMLRPRELEEAPHGESAAEAPPPPAGRKRTTAPLRAYDDAAAAAAEFEDERSSGSAPDDAPLAPVTEPDHVVVDLASDGAVGGTMTHATSTSMSAGETPPRSREGSTPPALGRIRLIPRVATVPGFGPDPIPPAVPVVDEDSAWRSVSDPKLSSGPIPLVRDEIDTEVAAPSVTITGTLEETELALRLAAASADRDRLIAAFRSQPDDAALLLALLAHFGDREPQLRKQLLEEASRASHGRALAIALHELAALARENREAVKAAALLTRAHEVDPSYAPVWMPLADALAAADDYSSARELYEQIAQSPAYEPGRRAFAAERAEALGRDGSIISGEIRPRGLVELELAMQLAEKEDWVGAIAAAETAATARPDDVGVLELLEKVYFESGDVSAASEAIGRQLVLVEDPVKRAELWRRRARLYRDALGRDAEAYRCLKEAHACAPADADIAYQLRTAAMVRGEWALAASLLYREIAASKSPRDRGALHLELALIYEQRLDDAAQAQVNFEQALAFDPTIPAAKVPLARRYEAIGRPGDAAKLYEEAATSARAADRAMLLEAAARSRAAASEAREPDLAAELDRAEAAGDLEAALDRAHQLWRAEPGHPAAFRLLANVHRTSGDLAALTDLTSVRASRATNAAERASAWLEVARLAEELKKLDQAARAYDLALVEDPGHIGALDARGALAFRLGDFTTADLIYRDLGAGDSVLGDDELALRRSIIAEQLGRDSEALALAQEAARLSPGRRDIVMRVQELATRIGELPTALAAARTVLELVPLDDDDALLATSFALVDLLRESGDLDGAVAQLEKILRDHPLHAGALEALAQIHTRRGDWQTATRYLYQLVPLAPSPALRAERLYALGEAVLVHLGDIDRADDVFLRASDLDPGHVPTLRRLLDVYWRADDPGGIVEVAAELADKSALVIGPTSGTSLARALVAAALVGDTQLAQRIYSALGDEAPRKLAAALGELAGKRDGRLQLDSASTAIAELARRGMVDLAKLRAAAAGTPVESTL